MILSSISFEHFFDFDIAPEVYSSLIVIGIIIILMMIIGIKARFTDPLKKPKGIMLLAEYGVNFFDNFVEGLAGPNSGILPPVAMALGIYLFLAFIFGLTGLPSPITYLAIPLSLGLISFFMVHITAIKYGKWRYFKRFIDPFPIFLPINLVTMWAPVLSFSLRLFGNAVAGWTIMTIIYSLFKCLSSALFSFIDSQWNSVLLAPILTPILHLYFDLFSGLIQTTVFLSLTIINIGQERPEDFSDVQISQVKGGN